MSVLPLYLVVEKLVDYPEIVTSQHYVNEYQVCRVINSHSSSNIDEGSQVLVGNKIFFDSADHLGKGLYFIYLEEVYGILNEKTITPMEDFVYIKADKDRKQTIKHGSVEIFNDTTYNPHSKDNVVQDGTILSICKKAKDSYFYKKLAIEAEPGDHIYTHHFLTDEENERVLDGEKYYEIKYENLYCKIVDEQIVMLNEWNFVSPVIAETEISTSGIVLDFKQKNELRVGVVNHASKSLIARGIKVGDTIFFKYGREYQIDIEGTVYYRINSNDILYKIK